MIVLYSILVLLLGLAAYLARRRTAALEAKFNRIARTAEQLARQSPVKEGNSGRHDPYEAAKRMYALALIAQKRERSHARFLAARQLSNGLHRLTARVREWKGLKLPYTFGAFDVASLLWLIDRLGAGDAFGVSHLLTLLRSYLSR